MSLHNIDAPPEAIDKVYAQSLFDLVEEKEGQAGLEQVASELEEILEVMRGVPEAREFMASRIIPDAKKEDSLRRIFEGRIRQDVLNLILLLNVKDRDTRFPRIAGAFDQLMQEKFGKVEVDVFTRLPLDGQQMDRIRERLRDVLQREPIIYTYSDPSMIGGIKIRVGDFLLDASITTRLRSMHEKLRTEGASNVKRQVDNLFDAGEF